MVPQQNKLPGSHSRRNYQGPTAE